MSILDEINEFGQRSLEVLRQPLEDRMVTISRAKGSLTFPANFQLIAAHNPCPCGYYGDLVRECTCTPTLIRRYEARLSGPLLDRIDIHVTVPRVDYDKLMGTQNGEPSSVIRERVNRARKRQAKRFADMYGVYANTDMKVGDVQRFCVLTQPARQVLEASVKRMQLSARAYHRVLKLSRTIADLSDSDAIDVAHVAEALQYRSTDTI